MLFIPFSLNDTECVKSSPINIGIGFNFFYACLQSLRLMQIPAITKLTRAPIEPPEPPLSALGAIIIDRHYHCSAGNKVFGCKELVWVSNHVGINEQRMSVYYD